ncbi:MAG: TIGR00159 family protein [Geobacter sp.]|nr:TIGR00159 family protein [Geobacter sp.]
MPYIRPQDIIDIIIMTVLVYQLYSWFKNTKAFQIVLGLGFLGLLYVVTRNLGLFMTSWILQELGTVIFIVIIVIFQTEIRQALYRFSLLRNFFGRQETTQQVDLIELANAVFSLAAERTGAIIVFQRREPLDEYLLNGVPLDGVISSQLIGSIFRDGTPLHDGAVVIREGRISQASCHLPLSLNSDLPRYLGTRHRAGLGLTERSDALVVIVSEERGEVSLAMSGELERVETPELLAERLHELLVAVTPVMEKLSLRDRLLRNFWPKLLIFSLVVVSWLIITVKQGGVVTVTAPLKFHNLPDEVILVRSVPEEVEVQLNVFSSLVSSPKQLDIVADINLAKVKDGTCTLPIRTDDFQLPLGVIVTGVNPSTVKVTTDRKIRKQLRVKVKTIGRLPGREKLRKITADPLTVVAEGPASVLDRLEEVETEALDLSGIRQSSTLERPVQRPAPLVRILYDGQVKVGVITK